MKGFSCFDVVVRQESPPPPTPLRNSIKQGLIVSFLIIVNGDHYCLVDSNCSVIIHCNFSGCVFRTCHWNTSWLNSSQSICDSNRQRKPRKSVWMPTAKRKKNYWFCRGAGRMTKPSLNRVRTVASVFILQFIHILIATILLCLRISTLPILMGTVCCHVSSRWMPF